MGHSGQKQKNYQISEIVVVAFNNCLTSSVIGMLDVIEICNSFWKMQNNTETNYFKVKLVSVDGEPIRSFNSIPIKPDCSLNMVGHTDLVIVPPVMSEIDAALRENVRLIPWLRDFHACGGTVASVCTGIFFLGESGLLQGRTATTNPLMASVFQDRFPNIHLDLDRILIDQDGVITAGPTYAFVDLMIYLVEKSCGSEVALQCSKLLLHDKNRSCQAPYFLSTLKRPHKDEEIGEAQNWLESHRENASITIESVANQFNMSPRNFVRRFHKATGETPLNYLQRLRVDRAKNILEQSNKTIDEITCDVGYTDTRSFGRLFRKYTSLSPSEYRKRFSSR